MFVWFRLVSDRAVELHLCGRLRTRRYEPTQGCIRWFDTFLILLAGEARGSQVVTNVRSVATLASDDDGNWCKCVRDARCRRQGARRPCRRRKPWSTACPCRRPLRCARQRVAMNAACAPTIRHRGILGPGARQKARACTGVVGDLELTHRIRSGCSGG